MLGDAIRRTRLGQDRTLADVARAARVSMQYLSEVERGRKDPSSEILAAICDGLGIELSDLLADVRLPLVAAPERRASVVRVESIPIRSGPADSHTTGPRDAMCLAA